MATITIDTSELREKLGQFVLVLPLFALGALSGQASETRQRIVSGTYWKNRTGKVAKSFQLSHAGPLTVRLESQDKVAKFLNTGTRAHTIRAKGPNGLLHFFWAKMGRDFYGRSVNHPGTKPTAYVGEELFLGREGLLKKADAAANKAVERAGLG